MLDIDKVVEALDTLAAENDGIYAVAYAREDKGGEWRMACAAHGEFLQLQYLIGALIMRLEENVQK